MAQNPLDDINDEINAINDTFRSIASSIEDQLSKALKNATSFERSGIKDLSENGWDSEEDLKLIQNIILYLDYFVKPVIKNNLL
jgi:hypothetical protein